MLFKWDKKYYFVYFGNGEVVMCDEKTMRFYNLHSLFSKDILFIEFWIAPVIPKVVKSFML